MAEEEEDAAALWLHLSTFPWTEATPDGDTGVGGSAGWVVCGLRSVSLGRTERATAVLLADPCFQLRSIQYLLGHAEPSALAAAAPATDKRHFSLHTCKCWPCAGSQAVLTTHHSWGGRNGAAGVCVPCNMPQPF